MSQKIDAVLSNYAYESPGVIANLRRLLDHGGTAGSGKMVILPVDQGFEHGPARSFQANPDGYDPDYHPSLAVETGCSAYAAPLGFIEAIAHKYSGRLPLILKVNNSDTLGGPEQPQSALTSNVDDALRLGCSAIGFTIYPGSITRNSMYAQIRDLIREARHYGLPSIVWAYPRGALLSKAGETGIDVVAYSAHIACQLGAHIVKVKPPTDHVEQDAARDAYESIPIGSLKERVQHVVKSCFNGKRMVVFSGGDSKTTDALLDEVRQIKEAGGTGSIVGRNAFQRSRADGAKLLRAMIEIYRS
ncbi:MAG: class I fructose-bisphosphate aldolase [Myxococcales bacterium]|nr:class I fructose-bisphosphate aldolase [Myxococcales bacterium]MCB9707901.1 class I fructose-bisphosphate aldolase [Myxococcales bacterium]